MYIHVLVGPAVVKWLSSLLAEQEVRGSIPGFVAMIKRRKSSIQPTNQHVLVKSSNLKLYVHYYIHMYILKWRLRSWVLELCFS